MFLSNFENFWSVSEVAEIFGLIFRPVQFLLRLITHEYITRLKLPLIDVWSISHENLTRKIQGWQHCIVSPIYLTNYIRALHYRLVSLVSKIEP